MDKLEELGIVTILKFAAQAHGEEPAAKANATSVKQDMEMKVEGKEAAKIEAKVEALVWKLNLSMLVFAVALGCVFMYLALKLK